MAAGPTESQGKLQAGVAWGCVGLGGALAGKRLLGRAKLVGRGRLGVCETRLRVVRGESAARFVQVAQPDQPALRL
jgi:hypothetical protein